MNISEKIKRLIRAAEDNKLEIVKELIDSDITLLEAKDNYGRTALLHAAWRGFLPIVQYLVSKSANVNVVSDQGRTPLTAAASYGYGKVASYLLEHGAKLTHIAASGSALMCAAHEGGYSSLNRYKDCVRRLLQAGIDVDLQNKAGETALMLTDSSSGMFELLLQEANPNIELRDRQGKTVLLRFCSYSSSRHDQIEMLLKKGADVNVVDNETNSALDALLTSHQSENEKLVTASLLIDYNISFDLQKKALDKVIKSKSIPNIQILLKACTALRPLLIVREVDVFQFSCDRNVEVLANSKDTFLIKIADGNYQLITFFNRNAKNASGQSSLEAAILRDEVRLVDMLTRSVYRRIVDQPNELGETLLMRYMHKEEIAHLLIERGADTTKIFQRDDSTLFIKTVRIPSESLTRKIMDKTGWMGHSQVKLQYQARTKSFFLTNTKPPEQKECQEECAVPSMRVRLYGRA